MTNSAVDSALRVYVRTAFIFVGVVYVVCVGEGRGTDSQVVFTDTHLLTFHEMQNSCFCLLGLMKRKIRRNISDVKGDVKSTATKNKCDPVLSVCFSLMHWTVCI